MQVKCIYCGAEVSTDKSQIGKLVACPECGHRIRVCAVEPLRTAPPQNKGQRDPTAWEHVSNEEVRNTVLYEALPQAEQFRVDLKRMFAFVLPRYNDLTLFAFGVAFVLLILLDPALRSGLTTLSGEHRHIETRTFMLGLAGLGMALSLIGIVRRREKSEFESVLILFFAVVITIGAGVSTWRTPGLGWLAVFPLWNQFNALLLLVLAWTGVLDTDCITDERATLRQVLVAVVTITVLLTACRYLFRLHWAVNYSIAVNYTLSFLGRIQKLFATPLPSPGKRNANSKDINSE